MGPGMTAIGLQKVLSCMQAPLSLAEEPGYIYVYKITLPDLQGPNPKTKENIIKLVVRRIWQDGYINGVDHVRIPLF